MRKTICKYIRIQKFWGGLLVFLSTLIILTGCDKPQNAAQSHSESEENLTPTEEVISDVDNTPTATPVVTETLKRISVDELMLYETVVGDFFGEKESFEKEFEKRCAYFSSFDEISEEEAIIYVVFWNQAKLNSRYLKARGEEPLPDGVIKRFLPYITEENLQVFDAVHNKIMAHNIDNSDDQILCHLAAVDEIVLSIGERAVSCEWQKITYEMMTGFSSNENKLRVDDRTPQTRKYWLKDKNGDRIEVYADTSIICNILKHAMIYDIDMIANNCENSIFAKDKEMYDQRTKTSRELLLDFDRFIESTHGLSGVLPYNDYYDPNSDNYHAYNPFYDPDLYKLRDLPID